MKSGRNPKPAKLCTLYSDHLFQTTSNTGESLHLANLAVIAYFTLVLSCL